MPAPKTTVRPGKTKITLKTPPPGPRLWHALAARDANAMEAYATTGETATPTAVAVRSARVSLICGLLATPKTQRVT